MKIHRSRLLAGWLVTALLHVAILAMFMQRHHAAEPPRGRRDAIQWLLPLTLAAPAPPVRMPKPVPARARPAAPATRVAISDFPPRAAPPQPPAATAAASAPPDDPFALPAAAPTARDIVQQARLDVGKIDQQLRRDYPERFPLPPPDSKQATLERGFNAAHDAVPPAWYQGAKMVELSTPDGENKTRTYKIITALVSYCINVHADGRKSYTSCPR